MGTVRQKEMNNTKRKMLKVPQLLRAAVLFSYPEKPLDG